MRNHFCYSSRNEEYEESNSLFPGEWGSRISQNPRGWGSSSSSLGSLGLWLTKICSCASDFTVCLFMEETCVVIYTTLSSGNTTEREKQTRWSGLKSNFLYDTFLQSIFCIRFFYNLFLYQTFLQCLFVEEMHVLIAWGPSLFIALSVQLFGTINLQKLSIQSN